MMRKTYKEAIRHTGARTKKEAILTAVEKFNRLKRLEILNARIRGTFEDFMTQVVRLEREVAIKQLRCGIR